MSRRLTRRRRDGNQNLDARRGRIGDEEKALEDGELVQSVLRFLYSWISVVKISLTDS